MAKILSSVVTFLATISLVGCNQTLDFRNAEISNNKIYENGENTGFTGKVTNIPLSKIPFSNIVPVSNSIGKATGNNAINDYLYLNSLAVVKDGGVLCDISVSDGILSGDALCKIASSNTPILSLPFKSSSIDGKVSFFYPQKNGQLFADIIFSNGHPNGKLTIYSIAAGKPIYKLDWSNGSINGEEEIFDENTGRTLFKGNLVNGKYDGEAISYYKNGDIEKKSIWKDGNLQQGNQSTATSNTSSQDCEDSWMTAFRREQGADAAVSADQMEEWKSWCSQGKKPQPQS